MNKQLRLFSAAIAVTVSSFAMAAPPAGYYDSLEGKSGVELKKAVKALIADHEVISYGDPDPNNYFQPVYVSTWTVFTESDTRTVDDVLCWWDMYSANNMWVSDGHPGLNIEHSVANSWWGGKSGSKEAYNDLYHLNPSNSDANGQKSNWPLGDIKGAAYWTNGVTTIGTPQDGLGGGATRVFDPYWSYKGDFARAYFYIFTIYDDIPWKADYAWMYNTASDLLLQPWAYEMLLQWSAGDAVSMKETLRNEAIYTYQKNRNPFIDCPQLADHIWGSKNNEPFHYQLYIPEEADPEIYPGWDETFPDMITGRWTPVSSDEDINIDEEYFIVTPTKNRAMTFNTVAKNNAMDECLYSPRLDESVSPTQLTAVPDNIATVKLTPAGPGYWYLGVYDPDLNFKGYINVKSKNSAVLSSSAVETCKATIAVDPKDNKTVITYSVSGEPYTLQYNASSPRFAAYTSTQNPIQLYRATDEVQNPNGIGSVIPDENGEGETIAIYDINGRRMNTVSVRDLESGVYIVVTSYGTKKIKI